jgi:hypothetical protein
LSISLSLEAAAVPHQVLLAAAVVLVDLELAPDYPLPQAPITP